MDEHQRFCLLCFSWDCGHKNLPWLTPESMRLIQLLVSGKSEKEIATDLGNPENQRGCGNSNPAAQPRLDVLDRMEALGVEIPHITPNYMLAAKERGLSV